MIVSRAPTRICLVGGGTDVDPYAAESGGAILNIAIDRRHCVQLVPRQDERIIVNALGELREFTAEPLQQGQDRRFDLLRAICARYRERLPSGFALSVTGELLDGCGLGTSGSVGVAVIGAIAHWIGEPLAAPDIARLAFEIETGDLGWAGGKQDQWAAACGGLALTRYGPGQTVRVEPLRCDAQAVARLRDWLLLVNVGGQRRSADLQVFLQAGMREAGGARRAALDELRDLALAARPVLEGGDLEALAGLAHRGWEAKKRSNPRVSTPRIDALYAAARRAGARGGKLVGAGGAGYFYLLCPPERRERVLAALAHEAAPALDFGFDMQGLIVEQEA